MKKTIYYLTLLILITSCSHRIVRTGYHINKSDYKNCDIVITKDIVVTDSLKKVGEIKLGESGFSIACSEADAIAILKNEACALNADLVNITEEHRSDLLSSCYRCRADFYKYQGVDFIRQSNDLYKSENIDKRISKDRNKNATIFIGAFVVGILSGLLFL